MAELREHFFLPGAPDVPALARAGSGALARELARKFPGAALVPLYAQAVGSAAAGKAADAPVQRLLLEQTPATAPVIAFARQCLPDASLVPVESLAAVGRAGAQLLLHEHNYAEHCRVHVYSLLEAPGAPPGRGPTAVLDSFYDMVRQKRKKLLTQLSVDSPPGHNSGAARDGPFAPGEGLLQLVLAGAAGAILSYVARANTHVWARNLSPYAGGVVNIPEDRGPPSRAYRKLLEAQAQFGRVIRPGERCVDLGASPGGWTDVALRQGAQVTAVDRSPLRDDLMRHPRVRFVRGDAFRYRPEQTPVDWLLSDVVAFPERILEIIDAWLTPPLCRNFCVTVKFRGEDDYAQLDAITGRLDAIGAKYFARRLQENKNEVTLFGECQSNL